MKMSMPYLSFKTGASDGSLGGSCQFPTNTELIGLNPEVNGLIGGFEAGTAAARQLLSGSDGL
jgi:hypothetical protein